MIDDEAPKRIAINIAKWIGYLALILGIFIVGLLSFWNVENPTVLSFVNNPLPVRPPQNTAGNVEYVRVNYCKKTNSTGQIVLKLVGQKSQIRLSFADQDTSNAGCRDTEIPIVLPTYAVDDTYYFEFDITYQINPIKTEAVVLKSQQFTVKSNGLIKVNTGQ